MARIMKNIISGQAEGQGGEQTAGELEQVVDVDVGPQVQQCCGDQPQVR
ncbi:hypothetical protein ACFC00_19380 [Streptomyces adustus]